MTALFLKLLNLSITAGWIVLAVIAVRFVLKRAPKYIHCVLWGIVGLRLCIPFSIESVLSLVPSAETVPMDIVSSSAPSVDSGIPVVNNVINPVISTVLESESASKINPLQIICNVASVVWIIGVIAMLIYAIVSYVLLRKRVSASIRSGNAYICDNISAPFILGVINPKIYLPSALQGREKIFVLAHEKAHISRCDHIWKPLAFLLLSVYWFNPLLWLGYVLLCRDIEFACDEKVAKKIKQNERIEYSETLLNIGVSRLRIAACPLAFGEVSVKSRIKNVLNYRKPAFWIIIVAVAACVVVSVCFLTNPPEKNDEENHGMQETEQDFETEEETEHVHNYVSEIILNSTCSAQGEAKYTCADCGDEYTEKIEPIAHTYTSQVTTAATCAVKGVVTYTCNACGDSYTEETDYDLSTHKFKYDAGRMLKFMTCDEPGIIEYTCSVCGAKETENVPSVHDYDEISTTATCTQPGVSTYECKFCGDTKTETMHPLSHLWKNATCTAPKTCTRCGEIKGEALGHTTYGGNCQRCKQYISRINVVGVTGKNQTINMEEYPYYEGSFYITDCWIEYKEKDQVLHVIIDSTDLIWDVGQLITQPFYSINFINCDTGEVVYKDICSPKINSDYASEWDEFYSLEQYNYNYVREIPTGDYIIEIAPCPPYSN